ncbi:TrmB family transcriptional regulator [Paenibacillus ehimensis]|uniref:TrmB family transcriptional regulator n=1 Tax=Paenibacillus ehimensis TaxID=79264 RepID=UPI00047270A5|nr:helix-turn-helix domain-containing protein [Paenibacillus ehimensis]
MIELLRHIGLSELEAKCYLTLHEESGLSGYEVAKRVSVSRTNVYAALRSLSDKGACLTIEGDPARYDAVPVEQLLRLMRSDFERTAERLVREIQPPPRIVPAFYNWQGSKPLEQAIRRLTVNASKTIVADLWSEDIRWFEEPLLEAERRGVTVILITLGEVRTALNNVRVHKRSDAWPNQTARKFSLLCDSANALLGSFGGEVKPSAVETGHPAVVETLKNAFYHDMLMTHIEADFGRELAAKYGENYEKLLAYYMKDKGWDI